MRDRKYDERAPQWGTYRWDSCARGCGNRKSRIECSDGRVLTETTNYDYSEHYLLALQFTREECRLELNRREKAKGKKTTVVRGKRGRPNLKVVA